MTTDSRPTWLKDWQRDPSDLDGGASHSAAAERPAWMVDIDRTISTGDRVLDDLADPSNLAIRQLPPELRVQLALAHYQRATAAALAEIAMHAEPIADTLNDIHGQDQITYGVLENISRDVLELSISASAVASRRRWWLLWLA